MLALPVVATAATKHRGPSVRRRSGWLLAAALLAAFGGLSVAPTAEAAQAPDLKIVKMDAPAEHGSGPIENFAEVHPSGHIADFKINVTVRNVGHGAALPSCMRMSDTREFEFQPADVRVPRLRKKEAVTVTVVVKDIHWQNIERFEEIPIWAHANDCGTYIPEQDTKNNRAALLLWLVPEQWKITQFSRTDEVAASATYVTKTETDAYFDIKGFNASVGAWVYLPNGSLDAKVDEQGVCNFHGTDEHNIEPTDGHLLITPSWTSYAGFIDGLPGQTFTTPVQCYGITAPPATFHFDALDTTERSKAYLPLTSSRLIQGQFVWAIGIGSYTLSWEFDAVVP